jgi:lipopolysaccharide export system permease protein
MRNLGELQRDIDSLTILVKSQQLNYFQSQQNFFSYYRRNEEVKLTEEFKRFKKERDSIATEEIALAKEKAKIDSVTVLAITKTDTSKIKKTSISTNATLQENRIQQTDAKEFNEERIERIRKRKLRLAQNQKEKKPSVGLAKPKPKQLNIDSLLTIPLTQNLVQSATSYARQTKSQLENNNEFTESYKKNRIVYEVQWHKIIASSMACIAMFLIGAPLGAIIKRGGLGVPFLVSILFFIIYYILNMQGEKLAKNGVLSPLTGVWMADSILLVIGLFFLRQARADARLFDTDFYAVAWDKWKQALKNRKNKG